MCHPQLTYGISKSMVIHRQKIGNRQKKIGGRMDGWIDRKETRELKYIFLAYEF